MKHKILYTSILTVFLTACGGSSSSSGLSLPAVKEPQAVTAENISQVISVNGASKAAIDTKLIPADLQAVSSSSVDSVVVTANSSFKAQLSVPASSVSAGKKVAGYLIETSKDNFLFVPATSNTVQAASIEKNLSSGNDALQSKKISSGFKVIKPASNKLVSIFSESSEGRTDINFSGWSNSDFTLDSSIKNLKLRIFPLLVNKTVSQVLSIDDIDLTDESNWVGVQELLLNVEAVATAAIQVSLTWDSQTDIDLWVVDKNGEKLYFDNSISPSSLGWLDYDNVIGYGPENIAFDYQMSAGDYKIYVHHYDGIIETNYQVTVAVGDKVQTYSGYFPQGVTSSDVIADQGVHFISKFSVDSNFNSKLKAPILLSQYKGAWKLPENSSAAGYYDVSETGIVIYNDNNGCVGYDGYVGRYFPTGFSIVDNELKVSDALLGGDWYDELANFTYSVLDLELSTLPDNCIIDTFEE